VFVSRYRTVVVRTDGSASSLRAVGRAGAPAGVVRREDADLLEVGNRGCTSIEGRPLGSAPADATRRSEVDVLVVHTTG
jgi:nucleotide-binding universal stress UspA family protein